MMRGCLVAVFLMINLNCVEAFEDAKICYILDGILIIYGLILTVLYCRLRMNPDNSRPAVHPEKQAQEGGIYAGLTPHSKDVYETISVKRPIV